MRITSNSPMCVVLKNILKAGDKMTRSIIHLQRLDEQDYTHESGGTRKTVFKVKLVIPWLLWQSMWDKHSGQLSSYVVQ